MIESKRCLLFVIFFYSRPLLKIAILFFEDFALVDLLRGLTVLRILDRMYIIIQAVFKFKTWLREDNFQRNNKKNKPI